MGQAARRDEVRLFRWIHVCRYFHLEYLQQYLGPRIKFYVLSIRYDYGARRAGAWRGAQAQAFESENTLRYANAHRVSGCRRFQKRACAVHVRGRRLLYSEGGLERCKRCAGCAATASS